MKRDKKHNEPTAAARDNSVVAGSRGFRTTLRRHVFASLMLGACAVFCMVAMVSVYAALQMIAVTHTLRVGGVLQAIDQSTPVKHDRGGVLSSVFVTEGEVVREGQILAALNTDALAKELTQARQDVARYLLRARCLRALKESHAEFVVPDELKQVLGQLQQVVEMKRETKRCKISLRQRHLETAFEQAEMRAALDLKRLHARMLETNQLINRTSKKLNPFDVPATQTDTDDLVFLKEILGHSIEATKAKVAYAELKTKLENKDLSLQRKYDVEMAAISDRLVNAQAELTRMENLLQDKFIYASTSGRIQRMRIREPGRRIAAGAYVLEIAPLTTDFEVTSRINVVQAPNLSVGQRVHVQLSGGLPKPIWVPARVEKILKTSENNRVLSIRLRREDLNKRDLLQGDNSLNGLGERSEAVISINSETAWQSLSGTVRSLFNFQSVARNTEV